MLVGVDNPVALNDNPPKSSVNYTYNDVSYKILQDIDIQLIFWYTIKYQGGNKWNCSFWLFIGLLAVANKFRSLQFIFVLKLSFVCPLYVIISLFSHMNHSIKTMLKSAALIAKMYNKIEKNN